LLPPLLLPLITIGGDILLTCSISGNIKWKLPSKGLTYETINTQKYSSIILRSVSNMYSGQYVCYTTEKQGLARLVVLSK